MEFGMAKSKLSLLQTLGIFGVGLCCVAFLGTSAHAGEVDADGYGDVILDASSVTPGTALQYAGSPVPVATIIRKYEESDPECNEDNTTWSYTIKCTVQAGLVGEDFHFETAVELFPEGQTVSADITDLDGNPVDIDGTILEFVPSPEVADEATFKYGNTSPDHLWEGFISNVFIPSVAGDDSTFFRVNYTFSSPVAGEGAGFFSDDGDVLYPETTEVEDAYIYFEEEVAVSRQTWSRAKSLYQ